MLWSRLLAALGPATLGVLAAHQLAYVSHDDGHIHGYLSLVGPWISVAALLGWILARRLAAARLSDVLALQAVLMVGMEAGERFVAAAPWTSHDVVAVGFALAVAAGISALVLGVPGLVHTFALRSALGSVPRAGIAWADISLPRSRDVLTSPGRSPPIAVT